jgi:hypothetical protein
MIKRRALFTKACLERGRICAKRAVSHLRSKICMSIPVKPRQRVGGRGAILKTAYIVRRFLASARPRLPAYDSNLMLEPGREVGF